MAKIQNTDNINEYVEHPDLLFIAGGNTKWYGYLGRQLGSFLQNWIYSYHMIQQFGIYSNEFKSYVHTKPAYRCS